MLLLITKVNDVWSKWGEICTITTPKQNRNKELSDSSLDNEFEISTHPNPTMDNFKVKTNNEATIIIYNELGQIMMNCELNEGNNYELTVTNLTSGVYTIKAISETGIKTTKVVVLR